MNDILLSFLIVGCILLGMIGGHQLAREDYKLVAIEHGCGGYNATTGDFEWSLINKGKR